MKRLRRLFESLPRHRSGRDLPAGVRRRMYDHLVRLMEEEEQVQKMLDLPVRPRLSVVDEARVAILRPSHREELRLDDQFVAAEQEMRDRAEDEDEAVDDIGSSQDEGSEQDQQGEQEPIDESTGGENGEDEDERRS